MNTPSKYRADIDFLRMISILLVCSFHYQLFGITGGYIGVDIFFVISGYLMTEIINREVISQRFSVIDFLIRRIRRLYPSLLFVILLTYVIGWSIFSPHEFKHLSEASIFSILGFSNIYYWLVSGYFDTTSLEKPLLHTWSLSVEFQFYFFWVIFLIIFYRLKSNILWGIMIISIVSFIASCGIIYYYQSASFYLSPLRIWEFSLGGIVIFIPKSSKLNKSFFNTVFIVSLISILYPSFILDQNSFFPGYNALFPVIGAMGFLYSAPFVSASLLFKLPAIKFFGSISYSLYLIHWPIFVYFNKILSRHISHMERLELLFFSIFLSTIVCFYFEIPLRNKELMGDRRFNISFALIAALSLALLQYNFVTQGLHVLRSPNDYIIRNANLYNLTQAGVYLWTRYHVKEKGDDFITSKKHLLIIGDSQSADLLNILLEAGFENKYEILTRKVFWECGSLYVPQDIRSKYFDSNDLINAKPEYEKICSEQMDRLIGTPAITHADVIIVGYEWNQHYYSYIDSAFNEIISRSHAQLYSIGKKDFNESSIEILNHYGYGTDAKIKAYSLRSAESILFNTMLKDRLGDNYVDMYSLMCSDKLKACDVVTDDYAPIFWDRIHLTKEAAIYFSQLRTKIIFSFLD